IAKFDECGTLLWLDYTDVPFGIDIKGGDIIKDETSGILYVALQSDDAFDFMDLNGSTAVDQNSAEECYLLQLNANNGLITNANTAYVEDIQYDDDLRDLEISPANGGLFVAGRFGNQASV